MTLMFGLGVSQVEIIPSQPQYAIINFHFYFIDLDGHPTTELYSGGWFSYNITITNEGGSDLNATYTVTVYNPDDSINGRPRAFTLNLKPNESSFLYPNQTFNLPTNIPINTSNSVDAHFADTAGAYKVNVTANTPVTYLRLSNDNSTYNSMFNYYQICFDAMPSYQEKLNSAQSQFYSDESQYFRQFQQYSQETTTEASTTQSLTYVTIGVSILAVVISYYTIAKDQRWNRKSGFFLSNFGCCNYLYGNNYTS
jgi:hypothetical protein